MSKLSVFKTISLSVTSIAMVGIVNQSAHALTVHSSRSAFEALLETSITDDYQSYVSGSSATSTSFDDTTMSAIFGETKYTATGWSDFSHIADYNLIVRRDGGDYRYCAGCNGSFELDFTSTSIGISSGVFGAGFDIAALNPTSYFAYAIFGDGSTQSFDLAGLDFFGLTSDLNIQSLHIGLPNGEATTQGYIEIDNLTIGSNVPTPAFVFPMLSGLFAAAKRHKQKHLDT